MFDFMLLLISCSAILCGCTFFPDNAPNSLCTVICPSPFLSYYNTGDLKEEVYRGIIRLSYIFDLNIVTGLYLVQN